MNVLFYINELADQSVKLRLVRIFRKIEISEHRIDVGNCNIFRVLALVKYHRSLDNGADETKIAVGVIGIALLAELIFVIIARILIGLFPSDSKCHPLGVLRVLFRKHGTYLFCEKQLIANGYGMSRAYLTGILGIVREILFT